MENNTYYKDGSARVIELLKDAFGDTFRAYFDGEAIPEEAFLPCVMVSTSRASITSGATGTDNIAEEILIMMVLSRKDDIGAPLDQDLTEYKIRKLVLGQDPNTQQYLPQSVMYVLRKHFTLNDGWVMSNSIDVDFAPNARGTLDAPINTMEAYITLRIIRAAMVPSRD